MERYSGTSSQYPAPPIYVLEENYKTSTSSVTIIPKIGVWDLYLIWNLHASN